MLRKSLLALSVVLAARLAAQTIVFTPNSTVIDSVNGGDLTFTATVAYSTAPSVLAFSADIPSGWSYVSTGPNGPAVQPTVGQTGTLGWSYFTTPASPVTFTFTLHYPVGTAGTQPLASSSITRDTSGSGAVSTTGPAFALTVPSNTAVWNGATGNWTSSGSWSGEVVPNNGGNSTYSASIASGNVTIPSPITINDLLFTGGTITGGTLNIAGSGSNWEAGVFSNLSQLVIGSGAFFTANGSSNHDFGGTTITNNGQFIWNGSGNLRSGNDGAFVNASGATFTDASSGSPVRITNTGVGGNFTFSNAGTYVKTGGTETKIEIPFTNQGAVLVNAGNLHFDSTFTQSAGSFFLATGSTAQFDQGLNLNAGSFSGSGTVSGNVVNAAQMSPGSSLGQLSITGNLSLLSTSQLTFDLGGNSQGVTYDFLSVGGTASLDGTLALKFTNNFQSIVLPGSSFTLLTASSLTGTFSNVLNNSRLITSDGFGSFLVNYTGTSVNLSSFQSLQVVPEPSTWALLALGLGTIGIAAWRRRRARQ